MAVDLRPDVSTVAPVRDLRHSWKLMAAATIVLGPLLVTLLRAVMPYWTDQDQAGIVAGISESPDRAAVMNYLSLASFPLLLLGALATGYAVRRRVPVLASVATGVLFAGLSLSSVVGASDVLAEAMVRDGSYDRGTIVEVTQLVVHHPTGTIGILAFVVGHLLGMVLLGVAVVRGGLVPWWAGAMIVASQPVHVISAVVVPSRALDVIAGWGLTTLGFAFVALAVLRMTDEEWD